MSDSAGIDSAVVTVNIEVAAVNDVPVIVTPVVTISFNKARSFTIDASDADGDALTISIETPPTQGTVVVVSATEFEFEYTPNSDYLGSDTMTIAVNDGNVSISVEIQFLVIETDAPIADDLNDTSLDEDDSVVIALSATDPDGDDSAISYEIATQPSAGVVSLDGSMVTYTPDANIMVQIVLPIVQSMKTMLFPI